MKQTVRRIRKENGGEGREARASAFNASGLSASEVVTIVRRLGFVALKVFETIQGNLVSSGRHQYAEALNDSLKPLVDMLVHFELEDAPDTEVDNG